MRRGLPRSITDDRTVRPWRHDHDALHSDHPQFTAQTYRTVLRLYRPSQSGRRNRFSTIVSRDHHVQGLVRGQTPAPHQSQPPYSLHGARCSRITAAQLSTGSRWIGQRSLGSLAHAPHICTARARPRHRSPGTACSRKQSNSGSATTASPSGSLRAQSRVAHMSPSRRPNEPRTESIAIAQNNPKSPPSIATG